MPMPVLNQVSPSVRDGAGTSSSSSANAAISVGEMVNPPTNTSAASTGTFGASGSGTVTTASSTTPPDEPGRQRRPPRARCRTRGRRAGCRPRAARAPIPAAAGWPRSSVNATVATSTEPKMPPTAAPTSTSTRHAGEPQHRRRPHPVAGRVRRRLGAPLRGQRERADEREHRRGQQAGGRRHRRWRARSPAPGRPRRRPRRAPTPARTRSTAAGCRTARAPSGPAPASRAADSCRRTRQRPGTASRTARRRGRARPARRGRPRTGPAAGSSTLAWPCRSTSRPSSGASSACASAKVAETAPASAYEPVVASTSRTTPSVCIEIGSRATRPAATNATAPGTRSTSRYGPSSTLRSPGGAASLGSRCQSLRTFTCRSR